MIKEFNNELQAKAIADSLGLFMTKYHGVYIVSNNKEEILTKYNLGFYSRENIFYDKEVFKENVIGSIAIKDTTLVDASSIEMPHNLKNCSFLFMDCISLKIPPKIPKGVERCDNMFYGCTSLKKAPIIPEGAQSCFSMFERCISLKKPPLIPKGVQDCRYMFESCTSLVTPPHFPENCDTTGALKDTPFERFNYDKRI